MACAEGVGAGWSVDKRLFRRDWRRSCFSGTLEAAGIAPVVAGAACVVIVDDSGTPVLIGAKEPAERPTGAFGVFSAEIGEIGGTLGIFGEIDSEEAGASVEETVEEEADDVTGVVPDELAVGFAVVDVAGAPAEVAERGSYVGGIAWFSAGFAFFGSGLPIAGAVAPVRTFVEPLEWLLRCSDMLEKRPSEERFFSTAALLS